MNKFFVLIAICLATVSIATGCGNQKLTQEKAYVKKADKHFSKIQNLSQDVTNIVVSTPPDTNGLVVISTNIAEKLQPIKSKLNTEITNFQSITVPQSSDLEQLSTDMQAYDSTLSDNLEALILAYSTTSASALNATAANTKKLTPLFGKELSDLENINDKYSINFTPTLP